MLSSLSARLLVLTILFVMLAEVLIFVPSLAMFREDWLKEKLASAQLAALALEATPNNDLTTDLESELLETAGVRAVVFKREATSVLILQEDMPPSVDRTYDL
ncbi:MAG: sensor histidine kinase, partial [Alphaproteobacteria bacterium]|nr:sensor histidine kinase [Alphaproteobacteria bacterium]